MKKNYRYRLDTGSKKFVCPGCRKKTFVKYIDSHSGDYLPNIFGRCDREAKCEYHLNPYSDGYTTEIKHNPFTASLNSFQRTKTISKPEKTRTFIPVKVLEKTMSTDGYKSNVFIRNLIEYASYPFIDEDVKKVVKQYNLGTITKGKSAGALTIPYIDKYNRIQAIQVKQFDKNNHTISTDFIHALCKRNCRQKEKELPKWLLDYNQNEKKVECLFGEHLLVKNPNNPIALVEAPKTAVYGTLYFGFPESHGSLLWLGVYNLSSLTLKKCRVLKGRDVYLFPDLSSNGSAYLLWNKRAEEFSSQLSRTRFIVSDLLEKNATDEMRKKGLDLADFLISHDWREFRHATAEKYNINFTESHAKHVKSADEETTFFQTSDVAQNNHQGFGINTDTLANKDTSDDEVEYQIVGEILDFYKAKGYTKLPDNAVINIPNFPGNSRKSKQIDLVDLLLDK